MDLSAEDKAGGIISCTAVHRRLRQGISHIFYELCSQKPKIVMWIDVCGLSVDQHLFDSVTVINVECDVLCKVWL